MQQPATNWEPEAARCANSIMNSGIYCAFIWGDVKIMVPFLGTLNIRCRIIIGIQTGTIILTTTHMTFPFSPKQLPASDVPKTQT